MAKKFTVLVVDDDSNVRRALVDALTLEGYDVLESETGEDALKILSEKQIDLVTLDVMMPGMDGLEVTERIKSNEATKEIQVIISSAKDENAEKLHGLLKGADDYIVKPFELAEFLLRVKSRLEYVGLKKEKAFYKNAFFSFSDILELREILEKEKLLSFILTKMEDILECERVSFFLMEGGEVKSVLAEGLMTEIKLSKGEGVVGHVLECRTHYITNVPYSDEYFADKVDKATGFVTKNILCMPVFKNDEITGVIELMNKKTEFTEQDLKTAEVYAKFFTLFF